MEKVIDKWISTTDAGRIHRKKPETVPLREPQAVAVNKPVIAPASPVKTTSRLEGPVYSRRFLPWQWLLKGLRDDKLSAVIILAAVFCLIFSLCVAVFYVVSKLLLPS